MPTEDALGDIGRQLDRLIPRMSTALLGELRAVLLNDRVSGGDPAFCDARIAAIDAELARRAQ